MADESMQTSTGLRQWHKSDKCHIRAWG